MWTLFYDMHSGGGLKENPYQYILIEASQKEAEIIFYNKFGHNPNKITCRCCGPDYSIQEKESIAQLTGFYRGCRQVISKENNNLWKYIELNEKIPDNYVVSCSKIYKTYQTTEQFCKQDDVLVIKNNDILAGYRIGVIPEDDF